MLLTITLNNIALIEHASVDVASGFNVITGETGAGKSLLLDGLDLCLGGRADGGLIRYGAETAEVSIQFDLPASYFEQNNHPLKKWAEQTGRTLDEELLIRRQLQQNGRSRAWLNGSAISVNELKQLSPLLVQLNSQHAQQSLLKPAYIVNWLDEMANLTELTKHTKTAYQHWQHLHQQASNLQANLAERHIKIQLLENQLTDVKEIININYAELETEFDELSNLDALMQQATEVLNWLDDDELGVSQLLGKSIKTVEHQIGLSQTYAACSEHLQTAQNEISEVTHLLRDYAEQQTADPIRLAKLDSQLATYHRLAKKYHLAPSELTTAANGWQAQLDELMDLPEPTVIDDAVNRAHAEFIATATKLDQARQQAATTICQTLVEQLKPLALPKAHCEFSFTPLETPNATGLSNIELLFSANVGMPMQPMHKIASGGELSRLALVMQMMNTKDYEQLLVFDEVDVGISGATAQVVGELLRRLGKRQQIIAITHQAQVAAQAHQHILVTKTQDTLPASSHISTVTNDARINELARMSGGVDITDITREHARSLLAQID